MGAGAQADDRFAGSDVVSDVLELVVGQGQEAQVKNSEVRIGECLEPGHVHLVLAHFRIAGRDDDRGSVADRFELPGQLRNRLVGVVVSGSGNEDDMLFLLGVADGGQAAGESEKDE